MNTPPHRPPVLYIFSGLPGAGKTTLSQLLATRLGAAYLRIDTMEQTLRELYPREVVGEGYTLAYRIAADNLRLGISVVADSCNPIELTRAAWEQTATDARAAHVNIEIICTGKPEHRRRIETRPATIPGLKLPAWDDVLAREYHPWTRQRIVIDTSGKSPGESLDEIVASLESV